MSYASRLFPFYPIMVAKRYRGRPRCIHSSSCLRQICRVRAGLKETLAQICKFHFRMLQRTLECIFSLWCPALHCKSRGTSRGRQRSLLKAKGDKSRAYLFRLPEVPPKFCHFGNVRIGRQTPFACCAHALYVRVR